MQGTVALVTGAAGGIGKACVEALVEKGAAVVALDIKNLVAAEFARPEIRSIEYTVASISSPAPYRTICTPSARGASRISRRASCRCIPPPIPATWWIPA